jgi:hypothetical protein
MKLLGYRGTPYQGTPCTNQGGVWVAITPEIASIYGYVHFVHTENDLNLLKVDVTFIQRLQPHWTTYTSTRQCLNKKALDEAFPVKEEVLYRLSEFKNDEVVMAFLNWWSSQQEAVIHGFSFPELPTGHGLPHHSEIYILSALDVEVGSTILELAYDEQKIQSMQQNRDFYQKRDHQKRQKRCSKTGEAGELKPRRTLLF